MASAADRLLTRVAASCAAHLPTGADVVVGLSGGLDSVVLLHLLHAISSASGLRLRALHVHHGLNARADDWSDFCRDLCAALDVPLTVERVRVEGRVDLGLEAAARRARYDVYRACGADAVVLAHHADDQGETVLIQMLRGAGPAGLSAMPECRVLEGWPRILRPLLRTPRSELHAYAVGASLAWIDDDSNADTGHARNFLRHDILPVIETRFPAWRTTLARVAANAADAMTLADALGTGDLARVREGDHIDLDRLDRLDVVRAANVLRVWLDEAGIAAPPRDRLSDWLRQLSKAGRHHRLPVPGAPFALVVHRRSLRLERLPSAPPGWVVEWRGEARLTLPDGRTIQFERRDGAGIRVDAMAGRRVEIVTRRGGERLQLAANRPHRPLKDLLRESGLPPWSRDLVPLVLVDGRLAWVCGVGGDSAFLAGPGESGLMPAVTDVDVDR
jgi:tRNA(Ile)-lysidine synthase